MENHAVFNALEQNLVNLSKKIRSMNEIIQKLCILQNSISYTPVLKGEAMKAVTAVSVLDEYRTYIKIINDYVSEQEKILKRMDKYNKKSIEAFNDIKPMRLFKLMEE